MRARIVWFVAGSAAGVYATAKARRTAYRLSIPGLLDQAAALGLGWRAFNEELRDGMETRERDVVRELSGSTPFDVSPTNALSLDAQQIATPKDDKDHT